MQFQISGMTCDGCARSVQKVIEKVPGVAKANVSLANNRADVTTTTPVQPEEIIQAIRNAGYDAEKT
jgi:Cu+-exporting ATPase